MTTETQRLTLDDILERFEETWAAHRREYPCMPERVLNGAGSDAQTDRDGNVISRFMDEVVPAEDDRDALYALAGDERVWNCVAFNQGGADTLAEAVRKSIQEIVEERVNDEHDRVNGEAP